MRTKISLIAGLMSLGSAAQVAAGASVPIMGFTPASAVDEHTTEAAYLRDISARRVSDYHLYLTAEPHRATSERNNYLADWVAGQWRQQGWDDVHFSKYEAYFTEPRSIVLEMTAPRHFQASLREDPIAEDPSTQQPNLPGGYNAYSALGDVTAEVVYARGGNPEDFELLRKRGISVKGKLVLIRYSYPYSFRGFKVMNAQREGAAGVILYSDPAEDGAARGPTMPNGPWGNDSHLQRGFSAFAPIAPGDPTTPGWPSVKGARHLTPEDTPTLPKIMVIPISARDSRPLLEAMTGPEAPKAWQGGLPITYRLGGGVTAHLKVEMNNGLRTFTNVEARIEGSEHPEQIVLVGNHRDAWVFGGADPGSGSAAMLELTRALGALKTAGWRPKRTIVVASWDGEEEGLVGSTEWAEEHEAELKKHLVAYLNVDLAIFGALDPKTGERRPHLEPYSVASLMPMIVEASRDVPGPVAGTLYDSWRQTRTDDLDGRIPQTDADMIDTGLDASSDHTAFVLHLGRPVLGLTYAGNYGVYHSIYDDRYFMDHFGDPGFIYSATIARFWGVLAMRLANADILPFDYVPYADTIAAGLVPLEKAAGTNVAFASLTSEIATFRAAAEKARAKSARLLATHDGTQDPELNDRLMAVEGNWLDADGLPGRPWNRHMVYGMRLNFLPLMLPGITEAIEKQDWPAAGDEVRRLERALAINSRLLDGVK